MSAEEESSTDEIEVPSVLSGHGSQPLTPPNSVLDRASFLSAIAELDIEGFHLDRFYRELHLQAYPEPNAFVKAYNTQSSITPARGGGEETDALPEPFLAFLRDANNQCVTMTSKVKEVTTSASGKSIKLDVELYDGNIVETIIARISDKGKHVASVSLSSQVGCSIECTYDNSVYNFVRDLSAGEIVEQVIHASRELEKDSNKETPHSIHKVVFMGCGEPLLNYDAIVASCSFFDYIFKLGRGCITVSTIGITPRIFDLTRDLPNVILCLRLYAPTQELRAAILPNAASQFGLGGIFEALDNHMASNKHQIAYENHEMLLRKRRVIIEYLMVKGETSKPDCAHELGELCANRDVIITLVPFVRSATTGADNSRRCPSVKAINEFKSIVASYDIQCSVRLSVGSDIRHSLVVQSEVERGERSDDGGKPKSEFWKVLDSVKKESTKKRRRARKLAEEDSSVRSGSSASEMTPLVLDQAMFTSPSNRPNTPDSFLFGFESGIESLDLDAYDDDNPEVFLSSSQELSMVLSDGMFSEDSFDDPCDLDPALEMHGAPSKNSSRPRDRAVPSPNSLLDRISFLEALDDAGFNISMAEIDAFYKALHELDYPPINDFSQQYEESDNAVIARMRAKGLVPLEVLQFALDPLNGFVTMSTKIHTLRKSSDCKSFRLYIQLHDEYIVETVVMRYSVEDRQYASISVSTQVSSPVGLSGNFNLQTSEIIEQIIHATRTLECHKEKDQQTAEAIGKLSFLGCGEPLLNYDNVVDACFFMSERPMWNINKGRMTISTIGVTPRIFDLTRDLPEVNIALDLRAPNQELRGSIIRLAQRYSLDGLMEALDNHMRKNIVPDNAIDFGNFARREKVIIWYKMVQDETCKIECAHELGPLCERHKLSVNLVPYIRRSNEDKCKCPSMRHINEFKEVVISYGVACSVKLPLGAKVQDPKKQFVVQAEGRNTSRESLVRMKYRDDQRSQIDFWETLAVVKKESNRKRKKSQHLKSQETKPVKWQDDKVMVANFSSNVVSFVNIEGSIGVLGVAAEKSSSQEVMPIIENGEGNGRILAKISADDSSASIMSEANILLAVSSTVDEIKLLDQECKESTEGQWTPIDVNDMYKDEIISRAVQSDTGNALVDSETQDSPVTNVYHGTDSICNGVNSEPVFSEAGEAIRILSGGNLFPEKTSVLASCSDNTRSSSEVACAVTLGTDLDHNGDLVQEVVAGVVPNERADVSVAAVVTTDCQEGSTTSNEPSSNVVQDSTDEISSDIMSMHISDGVRDTNTNTANENGEVEALTIESVGAGVGAFSAIVSTAKRTGEDNDDSIPEPNSEKADDTSTQEISLDIASEQAADNAEDTAIDAHSVSGGVAAAAGAGVAVGVASLVAMGSKRADSDDITLLEPDSNEETPSDIPDTDVVDTIAHTPKEISVVAVKGGVIAATSSATVLAANCASDDASSASESNSSKESNGSKGKRIPTISPVDVPENILDEAIDVCGVNEDASSVSKSSSKEGSSSEREIILATSSLDVGESILIKVANISCVDDDASNGSESSNKGGNDSEGEILPATLPLDIAESVLDEATNVRDVNNDASSDSELGNIEGAFLSLDVAASILDEAINDRGLDGGENAICLTGEITELLRCAAVSSDDAIEEDETCASESYNDEVQPHFEDMSGDAYQTVSISRGSVSHPSESELQNNVQKKEVVTNGVYQNGQTRGPVAEEQTESNARINQALPSLGAMLTSEIDDGDDYELSSELMDEIMQSTGDDFSFSSAPPDHSETMNMLAMQKSMMAQLDNSEMEEEIHTDPFSLYTIDEHETEDDDSQFFDDDNTEYADSGKGTPELYDETAYYDRDFDSKNMSKGTTIDATPVVTKEQSLVNDEETLEERLNNAEKARVELDASNKFLLSQMEHIALQANEELTAQIEQSEEFRQQMLKAQTSQTQAEEQKLELQKKLDELQFNDESGLLKERNELRKKVSALQLKHNELQAEKMRLEQSYAKVSSGSLPSKEQEDYARVPQKRLAEALKEIKRVHEDNVRLSNDADERSYEKEEELTEIWKERDTMQKALREAVASLISKEEQLSAALERIRKLEKDNAQLARDNDDRSLGKEQELLDMWKENDDLHKALSEAITCVRQREDEMARFAARSEEITHRRKLEKIEIEKALKESANILRKKEEELTRLVTLVERNADTDEEQNESELLFKNQALEQHLAAAYRFSETAPISETTAQLSEQVIYLEKRIGALEESNALLQTRNNQLKVSMQNIAQLRSEALAKNSAQNDALLKISEENAELRAMCEHLKREKAEIIAAAENNKAKADEQLKLVANMATAHLTGRLGLEARLQACEKTKNQLALDNEFMQGRMEVIDMQSVAEIHSLKTQAQHLRMLLAQARNEQTKAEEENILLELENVMSDGMSDSSSQVGSETDDSSRSSLSGISSHGFSYASRR